MALPVGVIEAILRLRDLMSPALAMSNANLKKFGAKAGAMFATHPAVSQRIERLQNLG